ncbi:RimK family protein [Aurantivibrio plasticivorans]
MSQLYLVVEDVTQWGHGFPDGSVISFDTYLNEYPKKGEKKTRVINLCNTDRYLSKGYYCSLLAEARGHKVLPSVNTLTDLASQQIYLLQIHELLHSLDKSLCNGLDDTFSFEVSFGKTDRSDLKQLSRKLFERFPCPLLKVTLQRGDGWQIKDLQVGQVSELSVDGLSLFQKTLIDFTQSAWRNPKHRKASRWDMAILVNKEEQLPPSDLKALKKMEKAASKLGIHAEIIGPNDYAKLGEFDALFIRETTAIDHHTYRFSRKAQLEGLVVIDDPTSILRCCNKVFLQDAFTYSHVPTPKTKIVSQSGESTIDELEEMFEYPIVLKIPNGSFSIGVSKVENRASLTNALQSMLLQSDLVIAQEFLYTDYDWRIGVLNNRPLYACRYYMADGHWQIYDHGDGGVESGASETLPTYEVPKVVLDAALKAARIIGDGLYGIDIKQKGNKAYVIEVNDNPSLDSGVEDLFLGDELYMQIMSEFARRLELRGR